MNVNPGISFFILILAIAFSVSASAQSFSMEEWHPGEIYLYSGDTVRGQIKYSFESETVIAQVDNRTLTFSSSKLNEVYFTDKLVLRERKLVVHDYDIASNNYEVPVLFEQFLVGKIEVLGREYIISDSFTSYDAFNMPMTRSYRRLAIQLYFRFPSGKIRKYGGSKSELNLILKSKGSQIKAFMKDNKLKANNNADVIKVIEYFNELSK